MNLVNMPPKISTDPVHLSDPEQVAIVAKLTNLLFAIVDEPALGADEGFTRNHLLHACRLAISLMEQ